MTRVEFDRARAKAPRLSTWFHGNGRPVQVNICSFYALAVVSTEYSDKVTSEKAHQRHSEKPTCGSPLHSRGYSVPLHARDCGEECSYVFVYHRGVKRSSGALRYTTIVRGLIRFCVALTDFN
jgi:hypothetical protein